MGGAFGQNDYIGIDKKKRNAFGKRWQKAMQQGFAAPAPKKNVTGLRPMDNNVIVPKPKPQPQPTYGKASSVWEAISGIKAPEQQAYETLETRDKFHRLFGGGGPVNISHTQNKDVARQYYQNLGYEAVDSTSNAQAHSRQYSQNDIDTLLKKAHGLHPDNIAPNANEWALNYFHQKLQSLTPEQRSYLSDPKVPEADKLIKLKDWTSFQTLDDVNEYARRVRQEAGSGVQAWGGWQGYRQHLENINKNDPYSHRIEAWTPERKKYLEQHGLNDEVIDPVLKDWYYFNQIWKHAPDDPRTEAYPYRHFQGDFEGFYKQRVKDLMTQGVIGKDFDVDEFLAGSQGYPEQPVTGGPHPAIFGGSSGLNYGTPYHKPGGGGGGELPATIKPLNVGMTDILNLLQLQNTYQPSKEAIEKLMNPYVATEPYREQLGSILNSLARRGVVNSTITSRAMERLGKVWLDRARELQERGILGAEELRRAAAAQGLTAKNLAARIALEKYLGDLNAWLRNKGMNLDEAYRRDALGERIREELFNEAFNTARFGWMANRQEWLDRWGALKDLMGMDERDWQRRIASYGALDDLFQRDRATAYQELFRLWSNMISGRYQIPTTTTTYSGGTSPFISFLAPAIGRAAGNVAEWGMDKILGILGMGAGAAASGAAGMGTAGATTLLADTLGSLGIGGTTASVLAGLAML